MRIASVLQGSIAEPALVSGGDIFFLRTEDGRPIDMLALLTESAGSVERLRNLVTALAAKVPAQPCASLRLGPPVPRPGKIIGIGRNYGDHAKEGGLSHQQKPRIFFKPSGSISGHGELVYRPRGVSKLDFEGELVAVVGRRLSRATVKEASSAVIAFMVGNDISAREFQFDVTPPQTSFAKGMDGFGATGPWMVTTDETGSAPDLVIRTRVNGVLMQEGHTGSLIFSVAECLAYVSEYITLEPGDLLFTGTPAGVGVFRTPPVFLQPGDIVQVEIERIGMLETRIG